MEIISSESMLFYSNYFIFIKNDEIDAWKNFWLW